MQEEDKKSLINKRNKLCSAEKILQNKYKNTKKSVDLKKDNLYCEDIDGDESFNNKGNIIRIKKFKEKKSDNGGKERKTKVKRNKARSVKEIEDNKRFGLQLKKNSEKIKNDVSENKSGSENEREGQSSIYSSYSNSEDEKSEKEIGKKDSIRSSKKHKTEVSSVSEKNNKDSKKDKNPKEKEKEKNNKLTRNSKKITTEGEKTTSKENIKQSSVTETQNKKQKNSLKNNSMDQDKEKDKKFIRSNARRKSLDNPYINERYEQLLNEMVLKQNGGSTLFLKNFEKGPSYQKEIEICVKNQKIKKKIKISSHTKPGCSGPGIVKTNQDAYFIRENFLKNEKYLFFGVCDGHGEKGEVVSKYVINKLPEYIQDLTNENISNAFKKVNNEIYNNKNIESDTSGTTVVSVIITPEKIICPNLGDSRAVLFKYNNGIYYAKNLSRDHKPAEPDENKRILFNNGRIKKCYDEDQKKYYGPDRVWLKNKEVPGLAMTRSIGDKIAHSVGVSDEPEVKSFEYDGTEKFMIVASDGIWEYLQGEDCIKIVRPFYEDDKNCEEAALALIKEAFRIWRRKNMTIDDITLIVVFFDD